MSKYDGKTNGELFKFTLNITSTFSSVFTIQLFNVIKSVVYDGTIQNGVTFTPFTINGVETIVAGTSSVGIQTNGSLNYKDFSAATNLLIQTPEGQNLTYRDIFSMLSSGQYLKMNRLAITSSLRAQLTDGTMNVINVSNLGEINRKSVPLVTFFDGTQNQNKVLDVFINTEICKNQGLEFTILPNSTSSFTFYLEA